MTTLVTLFMGGTVLRVECDALERDSMVPQNLLLVGCRNMKDNGLEVRTLSVPASAVLTYATAQPASRGQESA